MIKKLRIERIRVNWDSRYRRRRFTVPGTVPELIAIRTHTGIQNGSVLVQRGKENRTPTYAPILVDASSIHATSLNAARDIVSHTTSRYDITK